MTIIVIQDQSFKDLSRREKIKIANCVRHNRYAHKCHFCKYKKICQEKYTW